MFPAGCREAAEDLLAFKLVKDLRTSGGNVLEAPRKASLAKAKQTLLQLLVFSHHFWLHLLVIIIFLHASNCRLPFAMRRKMSQIPTEFNWVAELGDKLWALQQENAALKEGAARAKECCHHQQLQQPQQHDHFTRQQHQQDHYQAKNCQKKAPPQCFAASCMEQQQQLQHLQMELQRLRRQCKEAWQQVAEMKGFLNDYGLVWVGDNSVPVGCRSTPAADCASSRVGASVVATSSTESLPFQVTELQECLQELNVLAADGTRQVKQLHIGSTAAASSSKPPVMSPTITPGFVKLVIYKDGLQLHTATARPYHDPTANAILADIFDGYFPSVLKKDFPDGVHIQLVDCTSSTISKAAAAAAAAMCKAAGHSNIREFGDVQTGLSHGPTVTLDNQAFLAKLPKTVIRNGLIVPVRNAMQDFISNRNSSSSSNSDGNTTAAQHNSNAETAMAQHHSQAAAPSPFDALQPAACCQGHIMFSRQTSSSRRSNDNSETAATTAATTSNHCQPQLATLLVKSEDGTHTYVLKLPITASIGTLRSTLDAHRSTSGHSCRICDRKWSPSTDSGTVNLPSHDARTHPLLDGCTPAAQGCRYELRTAFPARALCDASMTLAAAGLAPSATLFMKHC
jgi:hypothetical protein